MKQWEVSRSTNIATASRNMLVVRYAKRREKLAGMHATAVRKLRNAERTTRTSLAWQTDPSKCRVGTRTRWTQRRCPRRAVGAQAMQGVESPGARCYASCWPIAPRDPDRARGARGQDCANLSTREQPETWVVHILIGDGIPTNLVAAKLLWASVAQVPLATSDAGAQPLLARRIWWGAARERRLPSPLCLAAMAALRGAKVASFADAAFRPNAVRTSSITNITAGIVGFNTHKGESHNASALFAHRHPVPKKTLGAIWIRYPGTLDSDSWLASIDAPLLHHCGVVPCMQLVPGHDTRAIVAWHRLLGANFCPETLRLWIRRGGLAAGRRWGSAARGSAWLVARSPTQQSTFSCVSRATRSRNRAWHSPPTRRGKSFPDASLPRPPPRRMRFLRTDGLTPHCHRCGRESWDGTWGPDLWRVPEQRSSSKRRCGTSVAPRRYG